MWPDFVRRAPLRSAVELTLFLLCAAMLWVAWKNGGLAVLGSWAAGPTAANSNSPDVHGEQDHAGHDHGAHAGGQEEIKLSATGLKNVGYRPITIQRTDFMRTISLPATVAERPGRSQIHIPSPADGVVTHIYPIQGAALKPNSPMFEIRLTHEEVVSSQRDLVQTLESLDVLNRELTRLKSLGEGVVPGKRILEQEYEQQKLEASIRADRQALLLHGLTEEHLDAIVRDRKLLKSLSVQAPAHHDEDESCASDHLFHVQELPARLGQHVEAGQTLAVLADHCQLYLEGRAFEDDVLHLREAVRHNWPMSAVLLSGQGQRDEVRGLHLLYLADHVDSPSRAFHFYVNLSNEVLLDRTTEGDHRFLEWRFKPGQRMQLRVPVELWEQRIVLPPEAVIEEAAENYVYRRNGAQFQRVAVHVEFRDPTAVVLANDGALFPGDVVAGQGAYQMHLALKNKSGGAIDPHAGHHH